MTKHHLKWQGHQLELGAQTRIMGVLNITPDSFSDGGWFFNGDTALEHAERMVAAGADIIDVGGESSRPFSSPVSISEECRRVLPVIEKLAERLSVPISVDTTKAEVARQAIFAGASIINDISALRADPQIAEIAAQNGSLLILMHMKGVPADMQVAPSYDDLLGEILDFLKKAVARAEASGIDRARLLIDPGIGFGKTLAHNLCLINQLHEFQQLGLPLLVGTSRKAFIRNILSKGGEEELSPAHPLIETGTQASIAAAAIRGAHIVRVHDVPGTAATLKIVDAIRNACPSDGFSGDQH